MSMTPDDASDAVFALPAVSSLQSRKQKVPSTQLDPSQIEAISKFCYDYQRKPTFIREKMTNSPSQNELDTSPPPSKFASDKSPLISKPSLCGFDQIANQPRLSQSSSSHSFDNLSPLAQSLIDDQTKYVEYIEKMKMISLKDQTVMEILGVILKRKNNMMRCEIDFVKVALKQIDILRDSIDLLSSREPETRFFKELKFMRYHPFTTILRQGDSTEKFYILLSGSIASIKIPPEVYNFHAGDETSSHNKSPTSLLQQRTSRAKSTRYSLYSPRFSCFKGSVHETAKQEQDNFTHEINKRFPGNVFHKKYSRGDYFGESCAFDKHYSEHSYLSVTESEVMVISKKGFQLLVHSQKQAQIRESINFLHQFPFLAAFSNSKLLELLSYVKESIIEGQGKPIYREGDSAEYIYLIKRGDIQISCLPPETEQQQQLQQQQQQQLLGQNLSTPTLRSTRQASSQQRIPLIIKGPNSFFGEEEFTQKKTTRMKAVHILSKDVLQNSLKSYGGLSVFSQIQDIKSSWESERVNSIQHTKKRINQSSSSPKSVPASPPSQPAQLLSPLQTTPTNHTTFKFKKELQFMLNKPQLNVSSQLLSNKQQVQQQQQHSSQLSLYQLQQQSAMKPVRITTAIQNSTSRMFSSNGCNTPRTHSNSLGSSESGMFSSRYTALDSICEPTLEIRSLASQGSHRQQSSAMSTLLTPTEELLKRKTASTTAIASPKKPVSFTFACAFSPNTTTTTMARTAKNTSMIVSPRNNHLASPSFPHFNPFNPNQMSPRSPIALVSKHKWQSQKHMDKAQPFFSKSLVQTKRAGTDYSATKQVFEEVIRGTSEHTSSVIPSSNSRSKDVIIPRHQELQDKKEEIQKKKHLLSIMQSASLNKSTASDYFELPKSTLNACLKQKKVVLREFISTPFEEVSVSPATFRSAALRVTPKAAGTPAIIQQPSQGQILSEIVSQMRHKYVAQGQ